MTPIYARLRQLHPEFLAADMTAASVSSSVSGMPYTVCFHCYIRVTIMLLSHECYEMINPATLPRRAQKYEITCDVFVQSCDCLLIFADYSNGPFKCYVTGPLITLNHMSTFVTLLSWKFDTLTPHCAM